MCCYACRAEISDYLQRFSENQDPLNLEWFFGSLICVLDLDNLPGHCSFQTWKIT